MRTRKSTKRPGSAASHPGPSTSERRPRRSAGTPQKSPAKPKPAPKRKRVSQRQRAAQRSRSKARAERQTARRRQAAKLRQRRAERRHELHGKGLHGHAVGVLTKNLKLRDHSARCSATLLFTVLLAAAGQCTSIAAACYRLQNAPSEQTIYNALDATLPDYTELERRVNRALRASLPAKLRRRRQRMAIDLTLIPYHGEPADDRK